MENDLNPNSREPMQTNKSILKKEYLTINDVVLKPRLGILKSRSEAQLNKFIYSSPMDTVTGAEMTETMLSLGEYPVVCRFLDDWEKTLKAHYNNPDVFFAIGAKKEQLQRFVEILTELQDGEEDFPKISVALDIAHGDSMLAHNVTKWLSQWDFIGHIMSGSISTPEAALRAVAAGCTHLRVGVGPGSACTTRLMTGCGLPNLSAVYQIGEAVSLLPYSEDVSIIADGGIKYPGDAVKYIAAGADAVMLGNALSTSNESAGWTKDEDNNKTKRYRGQASRSFQEEVLSKSPDCAEGAIGPTLTPTGSCEEVIKRFRGGMRSAISYLGLTSMDELTPDNVTFVKVTSEGFIEGTPHGT